MKHADVPESVREAVACYHLLNTLGLVDTCEVLPYLWGGDFYIIVREKVPQNPPGCKNTKITVATFDQEHPPSGDMIELYNSFRTDWYEMDAGKRGQLWGTSRMCKMAEMVKLQLHKEGFRFNVLRTPTAA